MSRPMTVDEEARIVDFLSDVIDDDGWLEAFDGEAQAMGFTRVRGCTCLCTQYGHEPRCGWEKRS